MFVLRTGLQGNGKTLNTIKEVDQKAAKEGRVVYFHNIRGFNPDAPVLKGDWQEFSDPHKWHELPQNALIVIDEAQTFFSHPQASCCRAGVRKRTGDDAASWARTALHHTKPRFD